MALVFFLFFFFSLQSHQFGWLSTRATLKEPTGGCGLAKADRLLASYCWFSTLVHCHCCRSPLRCGLQYGEWRLETSQEWSWTFSTGVAVYFPSFCPHCEGFNFTRTFFSLCAGGKNTSVKVFFFFFFKSGKKTAPEEDEAEETGDSVWRGHILCGCVLTVSDVGSSPTWSCKATEWRELSTGKNNYCGACAYCMLCETPLLQLVLSHFFSLGFFLCTRSLIKAQISIKTFVYLV